MGERIDQGAMAQAAHERNIQARSDGGAGSGPKKGVRGAAPGSKSKGREKPGRILGGRKLTKGSKGPSALSGFRL